MRLPIRVRLTLWYAGLLTAIIAVLGTYLVVQLRSDLREALDDEAAAHSRTIVTALADDGDDDAVDDVEDIEDFLDAADASLASPSGAQILDGRGEVVSAFGIASSSRALPRPTTLSAALSGVPRTFTAELGPGEQRYRVRVTGFQQGENARILVVALSMHRVENDVRQVLLLLLIAGPAAVLATTLAAYWLARKALRPVGQMTSDAAEIGSGRLDERVAVPSSQDEIRGLAETLNAMLDRIERGVRDRHQLVADASHELRTPLAVMRAEFDVSLRGDDLPPAARELVESARDEVDRISRTVDNLLALAAADEGRLELLTVRVDLRQVVEEAVGPLRPIAAAKDVRVVTSGTRCDVQVDEHRIHLAVTNLVENAIKFTPSGGTVRVENWLAAGEPGVTVADEGPGIAEEDRGDLFDRYVQVRSTRAENLGGTGLGLAICREVVLAHGGRTWVESELGVGSSFSLVLPSWRVLPTDPGGRATIPEQSASSELLVPFVENPPGDRDEPPAKMIGR